MAAALTILAKQRGDVTFLHQSLYYPVTDAAQDTASYPSSPRARTCPRSRWRGSGTPTCPTSTSEPRSPPRRCARPSTSSPGCPRPSSIVDENDVLRDEGEAYARKLTEAGVRTTSVRYNGTIHDFMMLNPLRGGGRQRPRPSSRPIHVLRKALRHQLAHRGYPPRHPSPQARRTDRSNHHVQPTPTVVLVHGAFAESASWNPVIELPGAVDRRHRRGQPAAQRLAATRPTCATSSTAIGRPVMLVGHSYGGMVITEAAADNPAVTASCTSPRSPRPARAPSTCRQVPGQHPRRGPRRLPGDRRRQRARDPPRRLPRAVRRRRPGAGAALMAATQRPVTQAALADGLPSPTRRGRPAVVVRVRRPGPQHPGRRCRSWPSGPARKGVTRSPARRTPSASPTRDRRHDDPRCRRRGRPLSQPSPVEVRPRPLLRTEQRPTRPPPRRAAEENRRNDADHPAPGASGPRALDVAYYDERARQTATPSCSSTASPTTSTATSTSSRCSPNAGYRVIVPYLRGHGPTRFLDPATPRTGQQAALGADVVDLLDALDIPRAVLAGYDWGGRAACVVAALWPERSPGSCP